MTLPLDQRKEKFRDPHARLELGGSNGRKQADQISRAAGI